MPSPTDVKDKSEKVFEPKVAFPVVWRSCPGWSTWPQPRARTTFRPCSRDLVIAAVRGRCGPPGLFGGCHPGSSLPVAEPACAVRSRGGGPWNSYARRAASHTLAKILDSRIERLGGFDRSGPAGVAELADSIPSSDAFAWLNGYAAWLLMRVRGIDICRVLKNDVIAAIVPA